MINIFQDNGGMPVIFIRYNPDGFIDKNGTKIKESFYKRRQRIIETMKYYMTNIPKDLFTVVHMYYNEDNSENHIQTVDMDNLTVSLNNMTL